MTTHEYLREILSRQTFGDDDPELKDLRQRRADIDALLRKKFKRANPSIRWAGSMAKGTMIRESYDGDMTCYFAHGEDGAGKNLKEIYESVSSALNQDYAVEHKASAIRVYTMDNGRTDLHVDVVPGRYTDENSSDVYLHRTTPDKERLKTNLQTHIDWIRASGVADAIRMVKLWKVRNGVDAAKTFVLELLVVKILQGKTSWSLARQLKHVWTQFSEHSEGLAVKDPANANNDLKPILDLCRPMLAAVAANTLWQIENSGWNAVFGEIDDGGDEDTKKSALQAAAVKVSNPTRPWCSGR